MTDNDPCDMIAVHKHDTYTVLVGYLRSLSSMVGSFSFLPFLRLVSKCLIFILRQKTLQHTDIQVYILSHF